MSNEKIRIDKYLWAIRLFKTRSLASEACEQGKVKRMGQGIKPAKPISLQDEYDVKTEGRRWIIRVTGLLAQRVSYEESLKYYLDLTPEEERTPAKQQTASFYTGKRRSKVGRPTKQQRRDLDEFMGSTNQPSD